MGYGRERLLLGPVDLALGVRFVGFIDGGSTAVRPGKGVAYVGVPGDGALVADDVEAEIEIGIGEGKPAKVELALAKGKNAADKRHTIKERDWKRDKARLLRERG